MKHLFALLLLGVSVAPSFAQSSPIDYKTAQAQAAKDPSVVQFDQQIAQLQAQINTYNAKANELNVKRNILQDLTSGYSLSYPNYDPKPQVINEMYQADVGGDASPVPDLNKQIAAAKAARTQTLWTKIEQINPTLQPVVEQLRKIATQATADAAANQGQ